MPRPPLTTRIRRITFGSPRPPKDLTQLFDWKDNVPGEGHERPLPGKQQTDWLLPLSTTQVDLWINKHPTPLPPLPPTVKRVWIVEQEQVRFVGIVEDEQIARLYQLTKPEPSACCRPREAQEHLLRDHRHLRRRLW